MRQRKENRDKFNREKGKEPLTFTKKPVGAIHELPLLGIPEGARGSTALPIHL